jgi:CRISPR-associated Csx2 family protein
MKVLISFLGAIPYQETRYYFGDRHQARVSTPYIQEAILAEQPEIRQVLVFTTKDAHENNFKNRIVKFDQEVGKAIFEEHGRGLGARLEHLQREKVLDTFQAIHIPDGNSEAEIFEVFGILYQHLSALPNGSKVYFDITYGFRSLPMLCIVLLHYVRTLHHIRVERIFYGNYEVGRGAQQQVIQEMKANGVAQQEVEAFKSLPTFSPILDLRAFAVLQEWTAAARIFIEGGNAQALADLMPPEKQAVGQQFRDFTDQILTCRGRDLSLRKDLEEMKTVIRDLQRESDIEAQLSPILEKIAQKIASFGNETALNGFAAVQWCIQHNLIQQGYTFLEETCKSFLIEKTAGLAYINDPVCRQSAGTALKAIRPHNWGKAGEVDMDLTQDMVDLIAADFPGIVQVYRQLTGSAGLRNDINHCGFMQEPKSPEALKSDLTKVFHQIKNALQLP